MFFGRIHGLTICFEINWPLDSRQNNRYKTNRYGVVRVCTVRLEISQNRIWIPNYLCFQGNWIISSSWAIFLDCLFFLASHIAPLTIAPMAPICTPKGPFIYYVSTFSDMFVPLLYVLKVSKHYRFLTLSIIKVDLPFLYSSMKKKIVKIWLIFDTEKWFYSPLNEWGHSISTY